MRLKGTGKSAARIIAATTSLITKKNWRVIANDIGHLRSGAMSFAVFENVLHVNAAIVAADILAKK